MVTNPNAQTTQTVPLEATQTYTVTVTDPAGGCVSTEQIVVSMEGSNLTASASGYISRYTPALNLDRNTLQTGLTAHGTYLTRHEFEFESDLTYVTYRGYSDGFGQPEWQWNASISKNTGAFNLSISAHDILNQTRSRSHTVAANYVEDSYRLVLGRYILFGVKWNFGKMNAVHSQRAQDAAWNMLW